MARALKNDRDGGEEPLAPERPELPPIQLQVSEEMQKAIIATVRADYLSAEQHKNQVDYGITSKGERLHFENWYKGLKDLYNSRREPKTIPWEYCSNRSLRIGASILDMLHARLLPTVVNRDLLQWNPGEVNDVPKVEKITKLMNWWTWVHAKMRSFFEVWTKIVAGFGDCLVESSWDVELTQSGPAKEEPVLDETGNIMLEKDGRPAVIRYKDVKRTERTKSKVYMKDQVFLQKNARDVRKDPVVICEEMPYRTLKAGEEENKFINVTTELRSKIPVEKLSSDQLSEVEQERMKEARLRNIPIKIYKEYLHFDIDGDGFEEDIRVFVSLEHDVYLGGMLVSDLTKSGKRPLQLEKFSDRLDRPDDLDGEGVLEKVKELAEEIDAIFNQLTDANTLSILRPGFYDPSGDLESKYLRLAPNKIHPVTDPQRNVFFPDISVQINHLLETIRLVLEFIERLTAASSYSFGKESEIVGGSGTATRTNAIVQAAETRFEIPAERLRKGAAEIITQHLDLIQLNIPPGMDQRILGEDGEPLFQKDELTAEGISGEFDAYLLPDPSMGSKQLERDLANMFYSILMQNPLVVTDPVKIYKVTADIIKSWDKDPEEFLGPEPNMDDIDDPKEENTLLVQGDFERVRAQIAENHIFHIKVHTDLLNSPSLLFLQEQSPQLFQEVVMATQAHIQEHQQMLQLMTSLIGNKGLLKGGNRGGGEDGNGGRQDGNSETNQGAPNQQGVEQASGPLASALDSKRAGESGSAQKS